MDTVNQILKDLPAYVAGVLAVLGAINVILATIGALSPAGSAVSSWCKTAGTDLGGISDWIRATFGGGPKPPVGPTAVTSLVLLACLPVMLCASACTPREIARTGADIAVAACEVIAADMQDEPDWLKLVCQVAGQVEPFLIKLPANSPEAKALLAGARR